MTHTFDDVDAGLLLWFCTSGFADDAMFSHSGPYGAARVFLIGERIHSGDGLLTAIALLILAYV